MPVIRNGVLTAKAELRREAKIARDAAKEFDKVIQQYNLRHLSIWDAFSEGFNRGRKAK